MPSCHQTETHFCQLTFSQRALSNNLLLREGFTCLWHPKKTWVRSRRWVRKASIKLALGSNSRDLWRVDYSLMTFCFQFGIMLNQFQPRSEKVSPSSAATLATLSSATQGPRTQKGITKRARVTEKALQRLGSESDGCNPSQLISTGSLRSTSWEPILRKGIPQRRPIRGISHQPI